MKQAVTAYGEGMHSLPPLPIGKLTLFIGPEAEQQMMTVLTAVYARHNPLRIIDGGNRFKAYRLAREIRRHCWQPADRLTRVHIARAGSGQQLLGLCRQLPVTAVPIFILDLPALFYEERMSMREAVQLLQLIVDELQRLRQQAPLIISGSPSPPPARRLLFHLLQDAADIVFIRE